MSKQTVERVFTRRSFLFFLFIAPAAVLTLVTIILATQYRQLQAVVSSRQVVTPFEWDAAGGARLNTVLGSLQAFSTRTGSDTLRLPAPDLNLLAAASPVVLRQHLYFHITAADSFLIVESTQSIEDQHRMLSWIFKKVIPVQFQYLNARLEGLPQWKEQRLEFVPDQGFLNGAKVPRAALSKRPGMSPRDFLADAAMPEYLQFQSMLDTVFYADSAVVLVRRTPASDSARAARIIAADNIP
jgi:hypothetical protein